MALVVNNLFADENKLIKIIKTKLYALEAETLLTGLKHPWCIAFLPDGTFLITEREGNLILVDSSFRIKKNISLDSIPIYARGQGGLFDVAIDQNFNKNNFVYISYNGKSENGSWGTELVRARFLNDRLSDITVLFKMQPKSRSNHHFGGRIVLSKKNELFLTLGDRGKKEQAQLLSSHHGSIVRMNTNETIPKSNPSEAQKQHFTKFQNIVSRFLNVKLSYCGHIPFSQRIRHSIVERKPIMLTKQDTAETRAFMAVAKSIQSTPKNEPKGVTFFK